MSVRSVYSLVLVVIGMAGVYFFESPSKAELNYMVGALFALVFIFYVFDRIDSIEKKVEALQKGMMKQTPRT